MIMIILKRIKKMLRFICFIFIYFVSLQISYSQIIKPNKGIYSEVQKDSCYKLLQEYLSLSKIDAKNKITFLNKKKDSYYFIVETDREYLYDLFFISLNKKRRVNYIRFLSFKQINQIFYEIE